MARRRREPRGKKINPAFWVFCEGESEVAYLNFLKQHFRLSSLQIHTRVSKNNISRKKIDNFKQGKEIDPKDQDWLVYDADVEAVVNRLKAIGDSNLVLNNPCIEFWFLLHCKNQTGYLTTQGALRDITNRYKDYNKKLLSFKLKIKLGEEMEKAIERAKAITFENNPSTNIYTLIEAIKKATEEND